MGGPHGDVSLCGVAGRYEDFVQMWVGRMARWWDSLSELFWKLLQQVTVGDLLEKLRGEYGQVSKI